MELKFKFEKTKNGGEWTVSAPQNPELIGYMRFIQIDDNTININTTVVPQGFSQRGTGKALLSQAINFLEEQNLKVAPSCSFVIYQMEKNEEWSRYLD